MTRYLKVAKCGDLQPWTGKTVSVNGQPVALFNTTDRHRCTTDRHRQLLSARGRALGEGALCGRVASCPVQAYEFDVTNGNCLTEPAYRVERFEVHVEGDDILVSEEPAQG